MLRPRLISTFRHTITSHSINPSLQSTALRLNHDNLMWLRYWKANIQAKSSTRQKLECTPQISAREKSDLVQFEHADRSCPHDTSRAGVLGRLLIGKLSSWRGSRLAYLAWLMIASAD